MRELVQIRTGSGLSTPVEWVTHVLRFLPWKSRADLALRINRAWYGLLAEDDDAYAWHVFLECLAEEGYYISQNALQEGTTRSRFEWMWNTRSQILGLPTEDQPFRIKVSVRFKPKADEGEAGCDVVLPLHQRLAAIRQSRKCSKPGDAGRMLMEERGYGKEAAADPFANASVEEQRRTPSPSTTKADTDKGCKASVVCTGAGGTICACAPGIGMRAFQFDHVFEGHATQHTVYCTTVAPAVQDVMNGIDACCIVFGQTGSGKTHTMFGDGKGDGGMAQRACEEVMSALQPSGSVSVSYVEIFGDTVHDLLADGNTVGQNQAAAQRWVLDGYAMHGVSSLDDLLDMLQQGEGFKRRAATAMNERSSRAHTLLILSVKQPVFGKVVESMLVLADLGGSEYMKRSGVADTAQKAAGIRDGEEEARWDEYYAARARVMEAVNINRGLLALKNCIRALHNRGKGNGYIPFQDTKLTLLLSGALGGKARTSMLITASPMMADALETINSLRFGEDCKAVALTGIKLDASAAAIKEMIKQLDEDIKAAQDAVRAKERWVNEKVKRLRQKAEEAATSSAAVEEGGVRHLDAGEQEEDFEYVTVSRMVGGEKEAKHLEELMERRNRLLGLA